MKKVLRVHCHVGVHLGAQVYTTLDDKKDPFDMFEDELGILRLKHRKTNLTYAIHPGGNGACWQYEELAEKKKDEKAK